MFLVIGGKLFRSNLDISINGAECNNNFGVLMLGSGYDHIDFNVNINHLSMNSNSNFLCRSLLDGKSRGIFNGKILVDKNASGTDAKLTNNNLLLSEKSEIQSNPQLEINCESVKCSHGSTSGNLDQEAIFYLRSRGITKERAEKILIKGFIDRLVFLFDLSEYSVYQKIKKWI